MQTEHVMPSLTMCWSHGYYNTCFVAWYSLLRMRVLIGMEEWRNIPINIYFYYTWNLVIKNSSRYKVIQAGLNKLQVRFPKSSLFNVSSIRDQLQLNALLDSHTGQMMFYIAKNVCDVPRLNKTSLSLPNVLFCNIKRITRNAIHGPNHKTPFARYNSEVDFCVLQ